MGTQQSIEFPVFKPIELNDRDFIHETLWNYQSQTSELTFTNLFMWRLHYRLEWSVYKDWLVLLCHPAGQNPFFLPLAGPSPRTEAVQTVLAWLHEERKVAAPAIERADAILVSETSSLAGVASEPTRDHFDYVYASEDLIQLSGRKYHNKKNHINRFLKGYRFDHVPFTGNLVEECLVVLEKWCNEKECNKYPVLRAETDAVKEALQHFNRLKIEGGAILIQGKVEAFSLGEMLNRDTAVIHVEKADPRIPELFTVINQQFCEKQWSSVPYINREQDLGIAGLRQAKLSYNPVRLIEKYRIALH